MMRRTCNILSLGVIEHPSEYNMDKAEKTSINPALDNASSSDAGSNENDDKGGGSSSGKSPYIRDDKVRTSRLVEWFGRSRRGKTNMSQLTVDVEESSTSTTPPVTMTAAAKLDNLLPIDDSTNHTTEDLLPPDNESLPLKVSTSLTSQKGNAAKADTDDETAEDKDSDQLTDSQHKAQMQQHEETLAKFQSMLQHDDLSTLEQVNLLYALGRLSAKLGQYRKALEYHQAELELTQEIAEQEWAEKQQHQRKEAASAAFDSCDSWVLFSDPDAVPKVLDGMAKIAKRGLNDSQAALDYYQEALKLRTNIYRQTVDESYDHCHDCGNAAPLLDPSCRELLSASSSVKKSANATTLSNHKPKHRHPSARPVCLRHNRALKDASKAVEETRQNIGRILFEQGKVDQAVGMIPTLLVE